MSEHDDRERPRPELEPEADEAELREAERLREALEGGSEHDLAELARSLRAAWEPGDLSGVEHERLVRVAMSRARGGARGRVIYVAFGATALAAAAAFALRHSRAQRARRCELVQSARRDCASTIKSRNRATSRRPSR